MPLCERGAEQLDVMVYPARSKPCLRLNTPLPSLVNHFYIPSKFPGLGFQKLFAAAGH